MKKRLTLHRETLAVLERRNLGVAGATGTQSCCYSDCCPPPTETCSCDTCWCSGGTCDYSCPCI